MLGQNVLHDLDAEALLNTMPTFTVAGKDALRARLAAPTNDPTELQKRQNQIRAIKDQCKNKETKAQIAELRKQLRDTEEDVRSVAAAADDTRHAEYYTQILWDPKSWFAWLNKLGWLNEAIVFFRTIFLPGLSIVLPIFVLLAPLIFYNLVLNQPLTFQGYFDLLQTSMKKAMPSVLGKPRFAGTGGALEMGEQFAHVGVSIAMFGASIWNQVSAAYSMRAVVDDMRRRSDSVKAFARATTELGAALGVSVPVMIWSQDQLGLFGEAWNTPSQLLTLLETAGRLDMLAAVALVGRTCFPTFNVSVATVKDDGAATVQLTDLFHPGVPIKERVYNSLTLGGAQKAHVLLTGPNRGGKSTLLKSLGCAVLMAQTVGVVFARSAQLPVFDNIITALAPQDVIGKLSLFEAEIEFAKDVKALVAGGGRTFLMMDEIFHGTNAHDGVEASQVFLDDLYTTKGPLFSIVSTHYMDLPTRYSEKELTQNLCMDASLDPNDPDRLVYTYQLKAGVNKFSSVREILRERGLLLSNCEPRDLLLSKGQGLLESSNRGLPPKKTTVDASKV
jgi:hypothetical protein